MMVTKLALTHSSSDSISEPTSSTGDRGLKLPAVSSLSCHGDSQGLRSQIFLEKYTVLEVHLVVLLSILVNGQYTSSM